MAPRRPAFTGMDAAAWPASITPVESPMNIARIHTTLALALALSATFASAQQAASAPAAQPAQAWKYKTKRLAAAEVDALLASPAKLLVLDLRRPDELIKYGSFPVFLNVQNKDLEKYLAYLPKDRTILTVSNHAQRAGSAATSSPPGVTPSREPPARKTMNKKAARPWRTSSRHRRAWLRRPRPRSERSRRQP